MGTNQRVVSWNAHGINDGTNYTAVLIDGLGLPRLSAQWVERLGKHPLIGGLRRPGRRLSVGIAIEGSSVDTLRRQLLGWFDSESEESYALVIEDDDDTNDRYVQAVCEGFDPVPDSGGLIWVATLALHGDVRWRSLSSTSVNWSVTGTGDQETVANGGQDDAYPVLTIQPTSAKSGAGSPLYRQFWAVRWRKSASFVRYPLDVVNNGLDTASLVATGTTTTLNGAVSAGASTITLTDASSFPTAGMAYITDATYGDEQIRWTGKSSNDLTGCVRGIGGTSDVQHGSGETIAVSKCLANGADLRLWVDGVERDRWLDDMDDATTKAWANLNFEAAWSGTLVSAIGSGDSVTSITFNESTSELPSAGIVVVSSEVFTYTSKNDATKTISGVTRAAHGSSAASHSAGATVWWCQHSVYLEYGNAEASAPTVDDDYKPAFELDLSTNTSWVYEEFGEDDGKRTGAWTFVSLMGTPVQYNGNQAADADPWVELGMQIIGWGEHALWKLYNPCGLTAANFTNGEKYASDTGAWYGSIRSGEDNSHEYSISAPSSADTWESWSRNETLTSGVEIVSLRLVPGGAAKRDNDARMEVADCTVTLNSSYTPTVTGMSEQGGTTTGYALSCTIENTTTGDAIEVTYSMDVNDELEVDTDAKTVTDKGDETSQFQAVDPVGGVRRDWLRLQPGDNVLEYTETGVVAVTVTVEFEKRYRQ